MIKNQKQAAITKERLAELKRAKEDFIVTETKENMARYELGINSFDGLIKELEDEIEIYDSLVAGNFHCNKSDDLCDISDNLIAARLAQGISQKALGERLGLKEQQIQRYEATDYETASYATIQEIAMALNLKFWFKGVLIVKVDNFQLPQNVTAEQAENATNNVTHSHSLLLKI